MGSGWSSCVEWCLREAQLQLVESERQASVGRLMAGIVHELNTPLGALRSATDTVTRAFDRTDQFLASERGDKDEKHAYAAVAAG